MFGIQNIGSSVAQRVDLVSELNVTVVNGYVTKEYVGPLEWFEFAILCEYQHACHSITVEWRSNRTRNSQVVDIRHAINQRPQPRPMAPAPDPKGRTVYPPPLPAI
jgi:hypothetical protein